VLPILVGLLPAVDELLPDIDALVALLPAAADVEFVLLPCANTCPTTTADTANAATMATIAIKFKLYICIFKEDLGHI
jgi:hypothetical protein